jgi:hypothetical protein
VSGSTRPKVAARGLDLVDVGRGDLGIGHRGLHRAETPFDEVGGDLLER